MPTPLTISIVVPVYNIEKIQEYFDRCIQSILTQTYPHTEIILVDDRSTDNTPAILQTLQSQNPTIRIITHPHNQGQGPARNTGVAAASGDYTWFVDQDDFMSPTACQIIADEAQHHDCPDIIHFDCITLYSEKPSLDILDTDVRSTSQMICYDDYDKGKQQRLNIDSLLLTHYKDVGTPWRQVIQSHLARSAKFPDFYPEDIVYIFEILARANRILFVDAALYCWHVHSSNTSLTINSKQDMQGHIKALQLMRETTRQLAHKKALTQFFLCHNSHWGQLSLRRLVGATDCSDPRYTEWVRKICPNTWHTHRCFVWNSIEYRIYSLRCKFFADTDPYRKRAHYFYDAIKIFPAVIKMTLAFTLLKIYPRGFCKVMYYLR